jgi:hypothetical protein
VRLTIAHTRDWRGEPIAPVYQLSGTRHEQHRPSCAIVQRTIEGASGLCDCGPGEGFEPDIFETCSYCGSIDVATLLMALKKSGTQYGGSDWKGFPHKFYIAIPCEPYRKWVGKTAEGVDQFDNAEKRHHKFYFEHFKDATPEQIAEFNELGGRMLGIKVAQINGALSYSAVCPNWQTYGVVGQELALNQQTLDGIMQKNAPRVPQWFIDKPFPEPAVVLAS